MSVETIHDLFLNELKDLYSAEKQITKALPKMAKAAASPELREAFTSHLRETEGHVKRLEEVFEILEAKGRGKTCEGMKGLLTEGSELLQEADKGDVRDAGLITAAQRVEHYEMAAYGGVREMAELMGHDDVVELLEATLEEEKAADKKLTTIAKTVNQAALSSSGEQDERSASAA
jgi:ferritin-like metal-binding protein YciE